MDYQASTPTDPRVLAKMESFFCTTFANPHSSAHCLGWESSRAVEHAAGQVARLIGADVDEIIFTSGATESNNMALLGLARHSLAGKRNRILLSAIEHKSVLAVGRVLQDRLGFTVEQIPVDREGFVLLTALEETMDDDVLVVSVMAVNNEIGTIQDLEKVSELVRNRGAIFHCDAAQAPIAMDISKIAMHADIVSLSSHKMYGPKGIAVAYISRHLQNQIEPLIYGGGQQNGLRSGTIAVPLCVGMGAAADLFLDEDVENKRKLLCSRRQAFIDSLMDLPWQIEVNGPVENSYHPGNANVTFKGFSAYDILSVIQPHLAASTGSACTSGIPEPSHVLKAIGLGGEECESSIRFSLGFGTNEKDIQEAVHWIRISLEKLSQVTA